MSATTVTISTGELRGAVVDGVRRFLGVPYAAPPFGERRFADPAPAEPWTGVREATEFGPTPPQAPYAGAISELLASVRIPGDDILTANVWAPAEVDDAGGAPVLLWIYGGAFERGASALPIYDGTSFARDGIVFVSVNYRVGSEGFSVLDDAPRNLGLRDVAAALRWVHREIAAFGGDPGRITVMGESAGGALAAALLAHPEHRRLIAGGIVQSGPLVASPVQRVARLTQVLANRLGVATTREAFSDVTPDRLIEVRRAQAAGASPLSGRPGYELAVDPESLPESPHRALDQADVPLLIGTNTDEYRLWFPPAELATVGWRKLVLACLALRIPHRAVRAYRRAWPGASVGEIFGQIVTDLLLRAPSVRAAGSRRAPTYVYEFAWPSPVRDLRATHALEIGFVFDRLADPDTIRLAGPDAPQHLADRMHDAWCRFVRTGDPGWPAYGAARSVRIFEHPDDGRVEPLPRAEALDALLVRR